MGMKATNGTHMLPDHPDERHRDYTKRHGWATSLVWTFLRFSPPVFPWVGRPVVKAHGRPFDAHCCTTQLKRRLDHTVEVVHRDKVLWRFGRSTVPFDSRSWPVVALQGSMCTQLGKPSKEHTLDKSKHELRGMAQWLTEGFQPTSKARGRMSAIR